MKKLVLAFALAFASTLQAADLPPHLKLLVGTPTRSAADLARRTFCS
jgi:hypothetical protein